jgi:RimJ/RimL family protein N-acetyltransferase
VEITLMQLQPDTQTPRNSRPLITLDVAAATPAPLALSIRPIRPSDRGTIERGFEGLTADSKYNRFHAPLRRLPEQFARYLTEVDGIDHVALIAFEKDSEASSDVVGVGRFVRNPSAPETAELAITVGDRFHGRGAAQRLIALLAEAGLARGVRTFTMTVLKGNRKARRFVARVGAIPQGSGGVVISYALALEALTALAAPSCGAE